MAIIKRKVKSARIYTIKGVKVVDMKFRDTTCVSADKGLITLCETKKLVGTYVTLKQSAETTELDYNCIHKAKEP